MKYIWNQGSESEWPISVEVIRVIDNNYGKCFVSFQILADQNKYLDYNIWVKVF